MPAVSDQGYLDWLSAKVEPQSNLNPRRTHGVLLAQLLQTPFEVTYTHDYRRAEDGRVLREEFLGGYDVDGAWAAIDCSVLEMLVALSHRAAFESYGGADDWFWHLLENLGLNLCVDETYGGLWNDHYVAMKLNLFMTHNFKRNGVGGLFPLKFSNQDQSRTELWYQMQAYVMEGSGPRV